MGLSQSRPPPAQRLSGFLPRKHRRNGGSVQCVQLSELWLYERWRNSELCSQRSTPVADRRRVHILSVRRSRVTAVAFALALGGCGSRSEGLGVPQTLRMK